MIGTSRNTQLAGRVELGTDVALGVHALRMPLQLHHTQGGMPHCGRLTGLCIYQAHTGTCRTHRRVPWCLQEVKKPRAWAAIPAVVVLPTTLPTVFLVTVLVTERACPA